MQFTVDLPVPKTVAELLDVISELRSRKAVYLTLITHLRICYQKSDAGPAEMKITREDNAIVSERHIEKSVIEIEERINYIDAQIEELQAQPFGGGSPPAAVVAAVPADAPAPTAAEQPTGPVDPAEKKGTPSGKPRAQGGRPS